MHACTACRRGGEVSRALPCQSTCFASHVCASCVCGARVHIYVQGWQPNTDDMHTVVGIHNGVNERAWQEVMTWERLHACDCAAGPRLKRFQGKPNELSPKARLLNMLVSEWPCRSGLGVAMPARRGVAGGHAARVLYHTLRPPACGLRTLCIPPLPPPAGHNHSAGRSLTARNPRKSINPYFRTSGITCILMCAAWRPCMLTRCIRTARPPCPPQGFALPFDRHDWTVDRCGKDVRYVIDFYNGAPAPGAGPASFFLDVRPALDSVEALWDRLRMQAGWVMSGRWKDA